MDNITGKKKCLSFIIMIMNTTTTTPTATATATPTTTTTTIDITALQCWKEVMIIKRCL